MNIDKGFDDGHYYPGQTYLKSKMLERAEGELRMAMELFIFAMGQIEQ